MHESLLNLSIFLQLRIADAGMVDGLEFFDEHGLGILDVAEGDGAVAEVALVDLRVDEVLDEVADAFLRVVGQRARGRLDAVGHHEDGLLLGCGIGTGVGEEQVVDGLVGQLVLLLHVEVLGLTLSVVGADEVADNLRQVVLVGQF